MLLRTFILALSIAFSSAAYATEQRDTENKKPKSEQVQPISAEEKRALNEKVIAISKLLQDQLAGADFLAQDIQAQLQKMQPINMTAVQVIKDMREILQEYTYSQPQSTQELTTRTATIHAIIEHLHLGVTTNFKNWRSFTRLQTRAPEKNLSAEEILASLQRTAEASFYLLEQTNAAMPYLGLGSLRKALRKTAKFINAHTPPKAYVMGAMGASALALWYIYTLEDNFVDRETAPMPHSVKLLIRGLKKIAGNRGVASSRIDDGVEGVVFVGEKPGVCNWLEKIIRGASFVPHETKAFSMFGKIISTFALKEAGEYAIEKMKLRYNNIHRYLFGNGSSNDSTTVIKTVTNGFQEIVGNDNIKRQLEPFIEYVINPEKFNRNNSNPGAALLFSGETRTGKTFLAERLAGEINTRFRERGIKQEIRLIEIKAGYAEIYRTYFGSICGAIRYFLEQHAPCIIFIDEIHLLGLHQEKDPKMLSDFLTLLSGTEKTNAAHPCLIVAATNHPEQLDKALRQKGRFGTELVLTYPHALERHEFIKRKLETSGIHADEAFIEEFVIKTQGLAFEQIEELIRHQKRYALIEQRPVTQESLDMAFNQVVYEIQEDGVPLNENESIQVSVAIASQLVLHDQLMKKYEAERQSMFTSIDRIIDRATVLPVNRRVKITNDEGEELKSMRQHGAIFSYSLSEPNGMLNEADLRHQIMVKLAAHIGQEIILNSRSINAQDFDPNVYEAYNLCHKIVSKGLKVESLSKERQSKLKEAAFDLMVALEEEVRSLLKDHTKELLLTATILDINKTLNQQQLFELFEKLKNPADFEKEIKAFYSEEQEA